MRVGQVSMQMTHIPTGITLRMTDSCFRSEFKLKQAMLSVLKSKVYMAGKTIPESEFVYEVPDDDLWPDDLMEFRKVG